MPVVVAVQVFYWMTNFENGVLNYLAAELHLVGASHDWYATPTSSLAMVALLIVWGALPFIVISVYAGLAQVPHELVEAARVDGVPSRPTMVNPSTVTSAPAMVSEPV